MYKPSNQYNPLYDPKTDNLPIDPHVQKEVINKPQSDSAGVDQRDQEFLSLLLLQIESGEINLYQPDSLIRHEVYEKLDEKDQGKVDQNAFNLLAVLRQIKGLWDSGYRDTFQIQNLAHQIRVTKERLEHDYGNVFIM